MKSLWNKRLTRHLKEQSKFLKLVFNEYFILALIFLIGAIGFWYSQALDSLPANTWWTRPVAIIILIVITSLFHFVSLLKEADVPFLLPKERFLSKYLISARNYSLILPTMFSLLTGFFLTPFLARGANFNVLQMVLLTITTIVIEFSLINNQSSALYYNSFQKYMMWENIGGSLIILIITMYWQALLGLLLAFMWLVGCEYRFKSSLKSVFNWNLAIKKETNRNYKIKRFYNLFTDVPGISSKVSRRAWLDWLFKPISLQHKNTYLYLFTRGFIRNTEYSNLFLRLLIVSLVLIYAIHSVILITVISALFLYLVEFQLVPLYKTYDAIVLTQIYPLDKKFKVQSFKRLLTIILILQWLLMTIAMLLFNSWSYKLVLPIGISLIIIPFLTEILLPQQFKKMNN